MSNTFADTIRQLRINKGLSQLQLADQMYVTHSTISRWEAGSRLPDAMMISRLAKCLGTSTEFLFSLISEEKETPNIIMVDDEAIILSEALSYAQQNPVALAFLDIEMGQHNGLEVCRELQRIRPQTNVIFLTAYLDYSLDAWKTGASGFIIKPITVAEVRKQLSRLRYSPGGIKQNE